MQDYLKCVCEEKQDVNNLFNALGVKVENIDQDACILRLPIKPLLLQGAQKVAGGIIATMADEAMAHCVISGLEEGKTTADWIVVDKKPSPTPTPMTRKAMIATTTMAMTEPRDLFRDAIPAVCGF